MKTNHPYPKYTLFSVLSFLLFLPIIAASGESIPGNRLPLTTNDYGFHTATTAPEKSLDKILMLDNSISDRGKIFYYLTGRINKKDASEYSYFFTEPFRASVTKAELELVEKDCGGKYIEGELCGLDFSPINCAQDSSEFYFYRTEKATRNETIISYKWPGSVSNDAIKYTKFRLVKEGSIWKLDGVSCGGDMNIRFNM